MFLQVLMLLVYQPAKLQVFQRSSVYKRERERERMRDNREDELLWKNSIWTFLHVKSLGTNCYDGDDDNDGDLVWQWW